MSNPEHLKIFECGAQEWNKWREENPDVRPDLSAADLSAVNLYKINLSRAYLNRGRSNVPPFS